MSAHTPMLQQASLLTGRQIVMLAIIALHALLISALMTMRISADVQPPETVLIGTISPPEQIPLPPPPEIPVTVTPRTSIPTVPVPIVNLPFEEIPAPSVTLPETGPVEVMVPQAGTGNATTPAVPVTALQFRAVRPADDYYPPASLRLQEVGTAIVQVCVAPSGRLEGNPAILTSSGSPRLDAAALKWASEALRFTPATRGGVPIAACKGFRVNFTLH